MSMIDETTAFEKSLSDEERANMNAKVIMTLMEYYKETCPEKVYNILLSIIIDAIKLEIYNKKIEEEK